MTSASTRLSVSGTASRPASAPAAVIPAHARRRRSPVEWLVAPAPAARLAVLRILVGVYATAWAVVRLPAHLAHADRVAVRWQPVGVLAPLESPPADPAILLVAGAAPLLGVLFVAGWRYRAIGPLFAVAVLLLATLDSSWGQVFHTEHLLVLHLLILAVAPAADVLAMSRRRPPPGPAVDGRYGWPVRLTAVVVVLTYMIAGSPSCASAALTGSTATRCATGSRTTTCARRFSATPTRRSAGTWFATPGCSRQSRC
jgi:hypothetical protein